jgi:hypothetical protein
MDVLGRATPPEKSTSSNVAVASRRHTFHSRVADRAVLTELLVMTPQITNGPARRGYLEFGADNALLALVRQSRPQGVDLRPNSTSDRDDT